MKVLVLIYHGFSQYSGISKKIHYQIKGLQENGHEVHVCTYSINKQGHRVRYIDNQVLEDFGTGKVAAFKNSISFHSIYRYVIENHIEFVYARSFHNANPFTVNLFRSLNKAGIKSVIEIPTYPYDQEYTKLPLKLKIDRLYRKQLAQYTNRIVTFTNDPFIFGQKTICISNGIDFDSISLLKPRKRDPKEIHLIGVAEVHYWHGFDRVLHGLGEYYARKKQDITVYFHIVGGVEDAEMYGSSQAPGFQPIITKYQIQSYVQFHGKLFGSDLDDLFNKSDFAIGSLARHRSGITAIKPLKNREYAARGIPFIFSEDDEDFNHMPYILKASADETPIDIQQIIDFTTQLTVSPQEIRQSIEHLSWKEQMKKVITQINQL